jgi:hypothetical protein
MTVLTITGPIDSRTLPDFVRLAKRIPDWGLVALNSQGGDVVAALAIGRVVRARNFETDVFDTGVCASACVFILAAGVDRSAYGRIGIHRPHYDDAYFAGLGPAEAHAKYDQLEAAAREYLREMGMPDELYFEMMRIPSDQIVWLPPSDIHNLGLDAIDPAYEEWQRSQYARRFGPDGYRRHLTGVDLIGECHGDKKCWKDVVRRYPEAVWDPRAR